MVGKYVLVITIKRANKLAPITSAGEDHQVTPTGKIKRASLTQVANWVMEAWRTISQDIIIKSFKKCCLTNSMDGSEDDALWLEGSEKESESGDESGDDVIIDAEIKGEGWERDEASSETDSD